MKLLLLAASGIVLTACGGGGDSSTSGSTASAGGNAAPSGDVQALLDGIKTDVTGPQKTDVTISLNVKGQIADPTAAALLSQPITLRITGDADAAKKQYDISAQVKLGAGAVDADLRSDGTKTWLGLGGKWYEAPPEMTSSVTSQLPTGGSNLDVASLQKSVGNASQYLKDAKVEGQEDVEGIACDHVSGTADVAKLAEAIAKSSGDGADAPTADDLAKLKDAVKNADIDLWIGREDHAVHRATIDVDADVTKLGSDAAQGAEGITLAIDLTATPADSVDASAPADVRPAAELQGALGQVLLPLLSQVQGAGS